MSRHLYATIFKWKKSYFHFLKFCPIRKLAEKHNVIGDVRGRGMFFGIDLVKVKITNQIKWRSIDMVQVGN